MDEHEKKQHEFWTIGLPDDVMYEFVKEELKRGQPLNLSHIHSIFGRSFFELIALMQPEIKIIVENRIPESSAAVVMIEGDKS